MSLWIRSQDKMLFELTTWLAVVENKIDNNGKWYIEGGGILGYYDTKERALEILNDIQDKMKNKYLAKVNPILSQSDFKKAIKDMERFNNIDLIGSNSLVDIQPINPEVIIYEMPEK